MVTSLISYAILGSTLDQSNIKLVPVAGSPFKDNFRVKEPNIMPSSLDGKSGFYVVDVPGLDREIYDRAFDDIQGLRVVKLSRLNADGSITFWDSHGKIVAGEASPKVAYVLMNPGDVGLEVAWRPSKNSDHFVSVPGTTGDWKDSETHSFSVIKDVKSDFFDLKMTIYGRYPIGTLSAKIGSETTIRGALFRFEEYKGPVINRTSVKVVITKDNPGSEYSLAIVPKADLPDGTNSKIGNLNLAFNSYIEDYPATNSLGSRREMIYLSNPQIAEWDHLAIRRRISLQGFIAHLPSRPGLK